MCARRATCECERARPWLVRLRNSDRPGARLTAAQPARTTRVPFGKIVEFLPKIRVVFVAPRSSPNLTGRGDRGTHVRFHERSTAFGRRIFTVRANRTPISVRSDVILRLPPNAQRTLRLACFVRGKSTRTGRPLVYLLVPAARAPNTGRRNGNVVPLFIRRYRTRV